MSSIPANWENVALGEICEFKYDKGLPDIKRTGGSFPVFGSNGIVGQHNEAITDGPTIIIGRKGSFGEVNFSTASCWPINTTYFIDKAATDVDLNWLAYRLKGLGLKHLNKAVAVPSLNREDAYRQQLLLPPLPEQRRIAAILDQADALRAKRWEALAQLDSLAQSIFIEMFGDLTFNEKNFPVHQLGKVCDVRDGTHDSPKFVSDGFPLITTKNLKNGTIDFSDANLISEANYEAINKRSKVDIGDILMPMIGTIGNPVLVDIDPKFAIKNVALIKFTTNSPRNKYILKTLTSSYFDRLVVSKNKGGTQKFLALGEIRSLPIPIPPDSLQMAFCAAMEKIEAQTSRYIESLRELDLLFASLQHRAIRGEL